MILSIITINYNNALGLKKTMDSVSNQTLRDFEYIIIDGNSTDKSVEIIKSYDKENLNWISEDDLGIYNAMNKGIKKAKGKYVLFLNSGDFLVNSRVLSKVIPLFNTNDDFFGGHIQFEHNSTIVEKRNPKLVSLSHLLRSTILHPSTFIKKELFNVYGFYNENLKIISDWEFFLKTIGLNGASYKQIDVLITHFDSNGISSKELPTVETEKDLVLKKYFKVVFNNPIDNFLFQQIKNPSKRIKYIKDIENNKFLRKVATLILKILSKLNFKRSSN